MMAEYADKNVKQLVYSIYRKIEEYEKWSGNSSFDKLVIDGETVGYVFCYENLLVSFGVNKKFRTSDKLKKVFEFIKHKNIQILFFFLSFFFQINNFLNW